MRLPWAERGSLFTALFEALAVAWLREASQSGVGELLALSWDEVHGILERAVRRGLERRQAEPVPRLGVDEKSFRKRHRYLTVVNDLDRGRVLYVAEGRRQTSLDGFWETLTPEQRQSIEAVAMDMWDPVGSLCRLDADPPGRSGQKDRLRQIPHRAAPGQGGRSGAPRREQAVAVSRR